MTVAFNLNSMNMQVAAKLESFIQSIHLSFHRSRDFCTIHVCHHRLTLLIANDTSHPNHCSKGIHCSVKINIANPLKEAARALWMFLYKRLK